MVIDYWNDELESGSERLTVHGLIVQYFDRWSLGRKLRRDVIRAASAMMLCRTAELGAYTEGCECGHISRTKYHSCRHRSCPQCGGGRRADWLERTAEQLLPCEHAHIIFTVPEELNILWQFNRQEFANRLLAAAKETLEELTADPKYLGASPGIISVLHTWGRNLSIHPHVHCLVTVGGVDADGQFVKPRRSIFLPGGVLRSVFRGKLRASLLAAHSAGVLKLPGTLTIARFRTLLNRLGRVRWNVRIQERYAHGASVAGYLARYLAGGPLPDRRLESADSTSVCFRYRDHRDGSERLMRLSTQEFLSRWFEHVPPRGLRMIRRAGLYANSSHARREAVRQQLQEQNSPETLVAANAVSQIRSLDPEYCPRCNTEVRVIPPESLVICSPVTTDCLQPRKVVTAGCIFRPP